MPVATVERAGHRPGRLARQLAAKKAQQIRAARRCPKAFAEYVLRTERSERRIRNAWFHNEWHDLWSTEQHSVLFAPVEHGKTQQVLARLLWEIGKNPSIRIGIISSVAVQAQKLLGFVRRYIEQSVALREVFPHLRPSTKDGDPWHQSRITVERTTTAKDPTIQVCGALQRSIVGSRLDLIVLDDVLSFDNTRTEEQRKKLAEWFDTSVMTRAVAGARVFVIGTPWHQEDLMHTLRGRDGWVFRVYAAVHNPDDAPAYWVPIWPEQWTAMRIRRRHASTPDSEFQRTYFTRVTLSTSARFRPEWIASMVQKGQGWRPFRTAPKEGNQPMRCFTGVDLGIGESDAHALTVLFTIAITSKGRRIVADIRSGHWTAPEIITQLQAVYLAFDSQIAVEDNGAQKFLVQMASQAIPVAGLTTTGFSKHHREFGVESLAVEMRNGWWLLPSGDDGNTLTDDARGWVSELIHYDPALHTGDRLMASWLAREAARRFGMPMIGHLDTISR